MLRVLVTGGNGFVGSAVLRHLSGMPGIAPVGTSRSPAPGLLTVGDLGPETNWDAALDNVNVIVHTAARVHQLNDGAADPLTEFRRVNVAGTLELARQAMKNGVRRFVYLSSVKVNGEATCQGRKFSASDLPNPKDDYAISKREAEDGLREIAGSSRLEIVIVRPPLVYGAGVQANFRKLIVMVDQGIPLPVASVDNRRSFVGLGNLSDLLGRCVQKPAAVGQTFMVSDNADMSTAELVRRLGNALGKRAHLLPFPPGLMRIGAMLLGRSPVYDRICGSLQVDVSTTMNKLGWCPPVSVDDGLRVAAEGYLSEKAL